MFDKNKEKLKFLISINNLRRVPGYKGNWKIAPAAKMQSNLQILAFKMQCCFVLGIRKKLFNLIMDQSYERLHGFWYFLSNFHETKDFLKEYFQGSCD